MPSRPKILISDDEPLIGDAIGRLARRYGLETIVDTSSNVVALAKEHRPSVILLDLRQRADGRDLLAALKADPATRDLKVIILSGVDDQFTRANCFKLGAIDYVVKPFDSNFIRKVARHCGLSEEELQRAPPSADPLDA